MYWKEIPVSVQADQGAERVTQPLDPRFQAGVDAVAMFDGSAGTDAYLMGWEMKDWGGVDGAPAEAAGAVAARINACFPEDFVPRIRELHHSGSRDPSPGAADHWMDD